LNASSPILVTDRPPRKTDGGLEKELANLWSGSKVAKKALAGRGPEAKLEIRG
jgi:hypothetical protein